MAIEVKLSEWLKIEHPHKVFQAAAKIRSAQQSILIDGSNLMFIDPFSIAVLGASLAIAKSKGHEITISGLSKNLASYMKRMNILDDINLIKCPYVSNNRNDCSAKLLELTMIHDYYTCDSAAHSLAKSMTGITGISETELDEMTCTSPSDDLMFVLQYTLSELLDNGLSHARRKNYDTANVWVASQYYASTNVIKIGIVDNGCGLLGSLQAHERLTEKTDASAILLALEPYVSCNRAVGIQGAQSTNEGIGLTTSRNIVEAAEGQLMLVSGRSACRLQSDKAPVLSDNVHWQGVAIGITCFRDKLSKISPYDHLPSRRVSGNSKRLRFE